MAISFNQKLSSNSTSSYKLDEFNGVDYTTTPTKVSDNRAIDISNYLPEGNSLVKRYGYEQEQELTFNKDSFMTTFFEDMEDDGETYTLEDTKIEKGFCTYKDNLLIFMARGKTRNDGAYMLGIWRVPLSNLKAQVEKIYFFNGDNNEDFVHEIKCSAPLTQELNGKLYVFVFGSYFVIEEVKYSSNGQDMIRYDVTDIMANDLAYIPTIALNYQPEGTNGKNIPFEQINILNDKFYVEVGFTLKGEKQGDIITSWSIIDPIYNIGNLIGNNDINLQTTEFQLLYTSTDRICMTANVEQNGGKIRISLNTGTTDVDNTKEKCLIAPSINDIFAYGKIKLKFRTHNSQLEVGRKDLLTAKVATVYGVKNSADRIFVGNTDNAPNTDWHTLDDENGNPDFTYFGTDTYNAIGSSSSEIVGYSMLNDGSLAIIKNNNDTSNIFVRTGKIVNSNEDYSVYDYVNDTVVKYNYVKAVEQYPTIATGLLIKSINKNTKFCLYDNKLIFNTEDGVYYLNLNNTTASQSYSAKELSYYIRNDLSSNIENSSIITDGKYLYVARENKEGQLRVYVADKNKYSFINSEAQYNWWVLDGIPAYHFIGTGDSIYFFDKNYDSIYSFNETFIDKYTYKTNSVTIGGETFNTEIMFDTDEDKLVIDTTNSSTWQKLMDIYKYNAGINKDNEGSKYSFIKNNVSIKFNTDIYMKLGDIFTISDTTQTSNNISFKITISDTNENQKYKDFVLMLGNKRIAYLNYSYKITNITTSYEGENIVYLLGGNDKQQSTFAGWWDIYLSLKDELLDINELYTTDNKKLADYVYIDNAGWFSQLGDFVATTLDFKIAKLEYNGLLLDIYNPNDSQSLVNDADTTFYVNAPISSYWYGKFTDLGTIDTLKSTKAIHFVPETRRGGYTTIGYRTRKTRQFDSDTTNLTTIRKYLVEYAKERSMNVRERMYNSLDLGINLNDIDFNNFSFESDYFARTYSSKKKIKNFAFIQLKFESPKAEDSTIAELSIQFQYTKNNKGVK